MAAHTIIVPTSVRLHCREVVRPLLVQSLSCVEVGLALVILGVPLLMWSVFPRVSLDWRNVIERWSCFHRLTV